MAKQVTGEIVSVPASESETGRDEVYIVTASASPEGLAPPRPARGWQSSRGSGAPNRNVSNH
jgi:hypothetical protein